MATNYDVYMDNLTSAADALDFAFERILGRELSCEEKIGLKQAASAIINATLAIFEHRLATQR